MSKGNEQIKRIKTERSMVDAGKPGGRASVHEGFQTRLPTLPVRERVADGTGDV